MANIRNTIELLCNILQENGCSVVKAEVFRSAKFNKNEVTPILWRLLFQILYCCENGKVDSVTNQAYEKLSREESLVYMKRSLVQCGYYSAEFAALPLDMSYGSRELLLALGWLICKENVIEKFMNSCTSPLDEEDSLVFQESMQATEAFEEMNFSYDFNGSITDKVKHMVWFNNKLRMNLRLLYATWRDKNLMKHKIHEATYGVSTNAERNHLTMYEVYLLRHPDMMKKSLELLERDNIRLNNLLKWKDHEDIYWKWMESVLDEKFKEKSAEDGNTNDIGISEIMDESNRQLIAAHDELQETILKYEYVIDQLEHLWESKIVDIQEEDLDNILQEIDSDIRKQRENISNLMYQKSQRKPPRELRLIYEKKSDKKVKQTQHVEPVQDIKNEILMLRNTVETLEQEIKSKQEHFKSEIEDICQNLNHVICIPPMGTRSYKI